MYLESIYIYICSPRCSLNANDTRAGNSTNLFICSKYVLSEHLSGQGDEYGCSLWNIFLKYVNLFPPGRVLVRNEHFIGSDIEVHVPVRCTFPIVYILAEKVGV